jgi:hypothetical protein
MFLFRKRSKTPAKTSQESPKKEVLSPEQPQLLTDGHIGRMLRLEERYRTEPFSSKLVEEMVQLYAVGAVDLESSRVL